MPSALQKRTRRTTLSQYKQTQQTQWLSSPGLSLRRDQDMSCSTEDFWFINSCEVLQEHFPCAHGCATELGPDLPNYVMGPDLQTFQTCLVFQKQPECHASHPDTARLCPCIPLPEPITKPPPAVSAQAEAHAEPLSQSIVKPHPVLSAQAEASADPLAVPTVKPPPILAAQAEAHAEPRDITSLSHPSPVIDNAPVRREGPPGTGLAMPRGQALSTDVGDAVKQMVDTGQMDSTAQLPSPTLMSPLLQLEEAATQSDGHAVLNEGGGSEVSPSDMSFLSTTGDASPGPQAEHEPLIAGLQTAAADGALDPGHAGDDS